MVILRKDVENELLKYGEEVNILNKSELARRLNCSRQTISNKLKRKDNPPGKRIYESKLDEYDEFLSSFFKLLFLYIIIINKETISEEKR